MIEAFGRKFELVDPGEEHVVLLGEDICKYCDFYKISPYPAGYCIETPCDSDDFCVLREVKA